MILHVEHSQIPGPFRITAEASDTEDDLLGWLWNGDPPEGTELQLVDEQLGYKKFDLTGVNTEVATQLNKDAADKLQAANPESYEDFMLRSEASNGNRRSSSPLQCLILVASRTRRSATITIHERGSMSPTDGSSGSGTTRPSPSRGPSPNVGAAH